MIDTRQAGTVSLHDGGEPRHGHVLVVDESHARMIALPEAGVVRIGRGDAADIVLRGAAVSRLHARIEVSPTGVTVEDLDSHNGTLVNGTRIEGAVPLGAGDQVAVGTAQLFVYPGEATAAAWSDPRSSMLDVSRGIVRHERTDGEWCIGVLMRTGGQGPWPPALPLAGEAEVRGFVDADTVVVAWSGWTCEELRKVLGRAASTDDVRAGIARFPSDGIDARTLLEVACTAARSAAPRQVGQAECADGDDTRIEVGDREVVVVDPAMQRVYGLVRQLAASSLSVLVTGETGTGKELVAQAVHLWSPRARGPWVTVNCAAFTESLLNAELFGHERGAFTGANAERPGVFEQAHQGTLFLDEVGELSPSAQAALLRVLETGRVRRIGGTRDFAVDVRLVAATHRDLDQAVAHGTFREDLAYRIAVARVQLPPLRRRPSEIPRLLTRFLQEVAEREAVAPCRFDDGAMRLLQEHAWPGNVRELRNLAALFAVTHAGELVRGHQLPASLVDGTAATDATAGTSSPAVPASTAARFVPLAEEVAALERRRMREALQATDGVQSRAAALLGVPRRTFTMKMSRYGLRDEDPT